MTLAEMTALFSDATLLARVQAACVIACESIRVEPANTANHSARVQWARQVLADPASVAAGILRAVLAQNPSATVAQAQAATDSAVQTAVNNAINLFVMGA